MSNSSGDPQHERNARLAELETTRRQIAAYQALLQEVPTVFERKFRERLHPVLERNREIAAETEQLREQLTLALPSSGMAEAAELPAGPGSASATPIPDPTVTGSGILGPLSRREGAARQRQAAGKPRRDTSPRWSRTTLWRGAGLAVVGLTLLALLPLSRQVPLDQLTKFLIPSSSDGRAKGLDELLIISNGSWIEVQDATGQGLYAGILDGERRFTIGQGLRLNAGRPDLVRYRIGNRPAAPLGAIEDVGWRTLASPLKDPTATPRLETDLPPSLDTSAVGRSGAKS